MNVTASVGEVANFTCAGNITRPFIQVKVSPVLDPSNVAYNITHHTDGTAAEVIVELVASADTNGTTFYCQFLASYLNMTSYNATSYTVTLLVLNDGKQTESKLCTHTKYLIVSTCT